MKERFKTIFLAGLILLSLYLTYVLWFDSPYLEEGVLPRYEFAYFTPPATPDTLLMPALVVLQREGEEETHHFRRGETKHAHVWQSAYNVLKRRLPGSVEQRPTEEELELLLGDTLFVLRFRFDTPLPENFLWERTGSAAELHTITLFYSGDQYYALLEENENILYRWINWGESELLDLITTIETDTDTILEKLPPRFVLQALYSEGETGTQTTILPHLENIDEQTENGLHNTDIQDETFTEPVENEATSQDEYAENGADNTENGEDDAANEENSRENEHDSTPVDETWQQNGEIVEEEAVPVDQFRHWDITVRGHIYIPTAATARELLLAREELPERELVSAFFLDPAMARRIEERDGATYFTDGKKGLRLYAEGSMEYTAPGLEIFNNRLSYSAALLEAAESQSLYGGWPNGVFLERREKTAGGYRFFWRSYVDGFPLVADESSSEMLVNDKGMPYYRRSYFTVTEKTGERRAYPNYKDALYRAINLNLESFPLHEATLLALEPVYRVIPNDTGIRAVPAWAVHFAETGLMYLHWETLEML